MQFLVVIPENVKAGQTIRIVCADGTKANVKVPKGLKTGDSFFAEISVDQLNNPQKVLDAAYAKQKTGGALISKGFLDRDISNFQDFVLAVCVGLMIGASIVVGFLAGILYATRHVEIASQGTTRTPPLVDQMPQMRAS